MSIPEIKKNITSPIAEKYDTVVMNITGLFFKERVTKDIDLGLIGVINMMTEDSANIVKKYNGKLLCVTRTGISAMFGNNFDAALQCAITISQDSELEERKSLFQGLGIGIDYGTICVGTVDHGGLHMPLVMSETTDTAVFLSNITQKYNSRILVTGSASAMMNDFQSRYNSRRLGKLYNTRTDSAIEIYDVYDGDIADSKYSKMRSRLFFENGVDLFLKGSYLEARSYFIELLKYDRNDAAAKQYVFKCDSCLSGTADENEKNYLELR